jgi:hypothetical protein
MLSISQRRLSKPNSLPLTLDIRPVNKHSNRLMISSIEPETQATGPTLNTQQSIESANFTFFNPSKAISDYKQIEEIVPIYPKHR